MEFSEGPWDIQTGAGAFVFSSDPLLNSCLVCVIKRSLKTQGYEKTFVLLCTIYKHTYKNINPQFILDSVFLLLRAVP